MLYRKCANCQTLADCIKLTESKPERMYISIDKIEEHDHKQSLIDIKPKFFKKFEDLGYKKRTIYAMWQSLQKLCFIISKDPKEITIIDMADYLQMRTSSDYTKPLTSFYRTIAREWYNFNNWDILAPSKQTNRAKQLKIGSQTKNTPLYKQWEEWFNLYSSDFTGNKSAYEYKRIYKRFIQYCVDNNITEQQDNKTMLKLANNFILSLETRNITKHIYRNRLKQYYSNCFDIRDFNYHVKKIRDRKPRKKDLPNQKELDLLSTYAYQDKEKPWFFPIFSTIVYTGLRISEVCNIQPNMIDPDNNMAHLYTTKAGDKDIQIVEPLREILYPYLKTHNNQDFLFSRNNGTKQNIQITPQYFRDYLKNISKTLKIRYFPPHHYRAKIACTLFQQSGYNIYFVKDFLQHKSVKTTEKYLRSFRQEIIRNDYSKFIPKLINPSKGN